MNILKPKTFGDIIATIGVIVALATLIYTYYCPVKLSNRFGWLWV